MRVRGERKHVGGRTYTWRVDLQSFARVLEVALDWCTRDAGSPVWLIAGVNLDVEVARVDIVERVHEALRAGGGSPQVRTAERGVAVRRGVTLIETTARCFTGSARSCSHVVLESRQLPQSPGKTTAPIESREKGNRGSETAPAGGSRAPTRACVSLREQQSSSGVAAEAAKTVER